MTQSRPNYILKLADGSKRVFEPHPKHDDLWRYDGRSYYQSELKNIGATPVPQEEPKVRYCHYFQAMGEVPTVPVTAMHFKSHEDAENYRLRCESIGPEWTDWEPVIGGTVWGITPDDTVYEHPWTTLYVPVLLAGGIHPTKERAQEWLAGFGKAWGLM